MFFLYLLILYFLLHIKDNILINIQKYIDKFYIIIFILFVLSSIVYIFFPSFSVPFEETFIEGARNLSKNIPLYPTKGEYYPYNTTLYGPIISLILLLFIKLPIETYISAKIPSFIVFILFVFLIICSLNSQQKNIQNKLFIKFPFYYLLYLLIISTWLYCVKAEPYFIFLVSLTIFIINRYKNSGIVFLLLGVLSALSSLLKLHGAMYIIIAFFCASDNYTIKIKNILLYIVGFIICIFLPFTNQSISLFSYIDLLIFFSSHTIELMLFIKAFLTLIVILMPIFIVSIYLFIIHANIDKKVKINLFIIICLELLITIPCAKSGSLINHLMPLIPVNAFIFGKLLIYIPNLFFQEIKIKLCHSIIQSLYLVLSFICIINVILIYFAFISYWPDSDQSVKEIKFLNNKYSNAMMGITEPKLLYLYYNRIYLGASQLDYLGYADLKLAGYSDFELDEKIKNCSINYFIFPKSGVPFMFLDDYSMIKKTLISTNTIKSFQKNFILIDKTDHYSVFECRKMDSLKTS
jgi:hypothetical protein